MKRGERCLRFNAIVFASYSQGRYHMREKAVVEVLNALIAEVCGGVKNSLAFHSGKVSERI